MASLYRRKRSPFWWIKIYAPGSLPLRFSSKTADLETAQEKAREITALIARSRRLWEIEREEEAALQWLQKWRRRFGGRIPRDVLDALVTVKTFRRKLSREASQRQGS